MRRVLAMGLFAIACSKGVTPGVDAEVDATVIDAGAVIDASVDASSDASAKKPESADPYGAPRTIERVLCSGVAGKHVAEQDLKTSFVDGNDLLAIVNRTPQGQLAADFSPKDLVDLRNGNPTTECDKLQCLRKEAYGALGELMGEMKKRGFPGKVESAYRSYSNQCGTFLRWAGKGGFCEATEQSALPGHSQHQLGTTVDMFTEAWAGDPRGVFREGFGCTDAGKFLQEHAWDFGFVMPYPIHPDDRHPKQKCVVRWDIPININPKSGYRFEHWHIRFVGKEAALRFKTALEASGLDTPNEITVEQWLRAEKGISGPDADLPVCDGCNCGACATLAEPGKNACDKRTGALHLDEHGRPVLADEKPSLLSVSRGSAKKWNGIVVEAKLEVPSGVLTQPPIVSTEGAGYSDKSSFESLIPYPETKPRGFTPLARAWVVAVEPVPNTTGVAWPWRAAITRPENAQIYDRANVLLPARAGSFAVKIPIPNATKVKVTLMENGIQSGVMENLDL